VTVQIPLTQGYVALVDDEDEARVLEAGSWCAAVRPHTVYAVRAFRRDDGHRTVITLHRFLTGWSFVDHVDRNGLNNTRANLRPATKAQNCRNTTLRRDNQSGFKGVTWTPHARRWRALIVAGGRRTHLGYFDDPATAARAYDAAALDLHGQFAALNFSKEIPA
jgi:hypothetical protein